MNHLKKMLREKKIELNWGFRLSFEWGVEHGIPNPYKLQVEIPVAVDPELIKKTRASFNYMEEAYGGEDVSQSERSRRVEEAARKFRERNQDIQEGYAAGAQGTPAGGDQVRGTEYGGDDVGGARPGDGSPDGAAG